MVKSKTLLRESMSALESLGAALHIDVGRVGSIRQIRYTRDRLAETGDNFGACRAVNYGHYRTIIVSNEI